jgi:hypothetical protein
MLTLLEKRAIKVPAESSKAIPVSGKDEAEARPLDLLGTGKAAGYDTAPDRAARAHATGEEEVVRPVVGARKRTIRFRWCQ